VAADRKTLDQFLAQERFPDRVSPVELRELLLDLASLCRTIGQRAADAVGESLDQPDEFVVREGLDGDCGSRRCGIRRGSHLVALLPVDSESSVEANGVHGTIFSVLSADGARPDAAGGDFLQSGSRQLCAGYAIYGPSIVLVLALGSGVHAFVLDRQRGTFFLERADIRIPPTTREIAIDASHTRVWGPAIRRYVDECLAGANGPRGAAFRLHWLGSIVAEAHRILMGDGILVCAGGGAQLPRLLHEANPISFIIERAGGKASTGVARLLDIEPKAIDDRTSLVVGSVEEVERIEAYHSDHDLGRYDAPLFAERGLFRVTS